ncbi:MAG: RecX family transcriptional regulator [Rhizobacter sp.]
MKRERSLKSRALQLLAQRDQSRFELRRKLVRHARARAREVDSGGDTEVDAGAIAGEVDALLDWLEANRFLSDARFAESRVHARAERFGVQRIRGELAQHAVELSPELAASLAASEIDRAAAVRARRFAALPASAAERAAQSRFLLGRGFSPELVQRLMRRLARADVAASEGALGAD